MIGTGFLIGKEELTNFLFDPSKPYAGCRICGEVYQSDLNRLGLMDGIDEWRIKHNKRHPERIHVQFIKSNRIFSPEAAQKLAPLGVVDFASILIDQESAHALGTASRAPNNDVEGS